jgi:hypothetical protein
MFNEVVVRNKILNFARSSRFLKSGKVFVAAFAALNEGKL